MFHDSRFTIYDLPVTGHRSLVTVSPLIRPAPARQIDDIVRVVAGIFFVALVVEFFHRVNQLLQPVFLVLFALVLLADFLRNGNRAVVIPLGLDRTRVFFRHLVSIP